jgi:hypothetical protein
MGIGFTELLHSSAAEKDLLIRIVGFFIINYSQNPRNSRKGSRYGESNLV